MQLETRTPRRPWIEEEPRLSDVRHELSCIVAQARARGGWVVLLALLASAIVAVLVSRRPPSYTSRVVLTVHDERLATGSAPPSAHQLVNGLNAAVLTRPVLLRVSKAHGLHSGTSEQAQELAVEDMRERIRVNVSQDYFFRQNQGLVRRTQLGISYRASDPELALEVARALADIVATAETGARRELAQSAVQAIAAGEAFVRDELLSSEVREAVLSGRLIGLEGNERLLALFELRRAIAATARLQEQLERLVRRGSSLLLEGQSQGRIGLQFEVLDAGHLAPPPSFTRGEKLALTFGLACLLAIPLLGLAIGVIDSRVADERRLRRLGLRSLGCVLHFSGDHVGSLQARMGAEKNRCPISTSK